MGRSKFHYINTRPLEPIIERWLNTSAKDAGVRPKSGADAEETSDAEETRGLT